MTEEDKRTLARQAYQMRKSTQAIPGSVEAIKKSRGYKSS